MKKLLLIAIVFCSTSAGAINRFDPATNVLKLDSIVVNDTQFNEVEVNLINFQVLKVGASVPLGNVAAKCTASNFTLERYNAISKGMSLTQVKQTIGCDFNPLFTSGSDFSVQHGWSFGNAFIQVTFDPSDSFVVNDSVFKVRVGF